MSLTEMLKHRMTF